jgi:hypothetical protein
MIYINIILNVSLNDKLICILKYNCMLKLPPIHSHENTIRRSNLLYLLEKKYQVIKDNYYSLADYITKFCNLYQRIEKDSKSNLYELLTLQSKLTYILHKINKTYYDLLIKINEFTLQSNEDACYEKIPLHKRDEFITIRNKTEKYGEIYIYIKKLEDKTNRQKNKLLRTVEAYLNKIKDDIYDGKEFLMKNIDRTLISNYIIMKNNGYQDKMTSLQVIDDIIEYYDSIIN